MLSYLPMFPGKVQPEVQSVDISSTEDLESLRLTLTDLSTRSATQEVQTVTMTYSNTDGVWQLAMNGVYTGECYIAENLTRGHWLLRAGFQLFHAFLIL